MKNTLNKTLTGVLMLLFLKMTGCFMGQGTSDGESVYEYKTSLSTKIQSVSDVFFDCGADVKHPCEVNPNYPAHIKVIPSGIPYISSGEINDMGAYILQKNVRVYWVCPFQKSQGGGEFQTKTPSTIGSCLDDNRTMLRNGPAQLIIVFKTPPTSKSYYFFNVVQINWTGLGK